MPIQREKARELRVLSAENRVAAKKLLEGTT